MDEIAVYDKYIRKYEAAGALKAKTFGEVLEEAAEKYADNIAFVDRSRRTTYREFKQRVDNLSAGMYRLGLRKADNILLQMPNCIEFMEVLFACLQIGIRPVLVLPTHRENEVRAFAKLLAPKAYITTDKYMGYDYCALALKVKEMCPAIEYIISDKKCKGTTHLETLYDDPMQINENVQYKETALYLLSGGTTGTPKLIPKTHTAYITNAYLSAKRCEFDKDTVYMAILSIAHDYPLCSPGVLGAFCNGAKSVLGYNPDCDEIFEMIEKERVTTVSIVPAIANVWMEYLEYEEDYEFQTLSKLIVGASKLEENLGKELIKKFQCTIYQGYGLGEGITCFTKSSDSLEVQLNTQGRPISEYDEIKIVDSFGSAMPGGVPGELIERGPYTFTGYYGAVELNNQKFTSDGFFCTGDKAYVTEDGNVKILGRVVEQINRAGENIIPSEIETYIKKINGVIEVAVFGIPDENLGEKTCACVAGDRSTINKHYIYEGLREQKVASFKIPDAVHILDAIPYTNIGKVDKRRLLDMVRGENGLH